MCQILLTNGVDKNPRNNEEFTPLHLAAFGGHLDVCKILLENKVDKNAKTDEGRTAFHDAVTGGHIQGTIQILRKTQFTNYLTHL